MITDPKFKVGDLMKSPNFGYFFIVDLDIERQDYIVYWFDLKRLNPITFTVLDTDPFDMSRPPWIRESMPNLISRV